MLYVGLSENNMDCNRKEGCNMPNELIKSAAIWALCIVMLAYYLILAVEPPQDVNTLNGGASQAPLFIYP